MFCHASGFKATIGSLRSAEVAPIMSDIGAIYAFALPRLPNKLTPKMPGVDHVALQPSCVSEA